MLIREATNTNYIVFGLTCRGSEHMIYHTCLWFDLPGLGTHDLPYLSLVWPAGARNTWSTILVFGLTCRGSEHMIYHTCLWFDLPGLEHMIYHTCLWFDLPGLGTHDLPYLSLVWPAGARNTWSTILVFGLTCRGSEHMIYHTCLWFDLPGLEHMIYHTCLWFDLPGLGTHDLPYLSLVWPAGARNTWSTILVFGLTCQGLNTWSTILVFGLTCQGLNTWSTILVFGLTCRGLNTWSTILVASALLSTTDDNRFIGRSNK